MKTGIRRGKMAVSGKGTGKKSAKKKTTVKKSAVKKAAVKKTAVKKTVGKKKAAPVKKSAVKKTAGKKTAVKKAAAQKKTAIRKNASVRKAVPAPVTAAPAPEKKPVVRTGAERRRQILAVVVTALVILLAMAVINRREGLDKVRRLVKGARQAEKAGQYWKGIRKLDAALRILKRIQDRIPPEKKKRHRMVNRYRKGIKQLLKRLLLLEADRLRKLARKLEGEGREDDALKALKRAQDVLNRLSIPPWDKDRRLQDELKKKIKRLEKDRRRLGLRNEDIERLLKRARQDEDDGLFKDALKKLDKVLDLLDKLEKDVRKKDREERKPWLQKIRNLRKGIRGSRRRINRKLLARDRRGVRDRKENGDTDRAARRRRLEDENRKLREALRKKNATGTTAGRGRTGSGTTGGSTLKPKDIRTRVKDVNTSGKKKIDYGKSAGIEKD